jgi:hypothetical protein
MAGLDDLRKRVEAAEQRFGLIASRNHKYSERLTSLVAQMERSHAEQRQEIAALGARIGQLEQENAELRSMLMGLLHAIESGGDAVVDHALRDLEHRVGRLVGTATAAVRAASEIAPAGADEDQEVRVRRPPEPETVTIDDVPEAEMLPGSASELLDRVEAAASALLASGLGGDGDADGGLGEEIEALLESAIHGAPVIGIDAVPARPAGAEEAGDDAAAPEADAAPDVGADAARSAA